MRTLAVPNSSTLASTGDRHEIWGSFLRLGMQDDELVPALPVLQSTLAAEVTTMSYVLDTGTRASISNL